MRNDQASGLRRLFARRTRRPLGVGGADATPVVGDLARTLAELGSRVLVIDRTRGELAARLNARVRFELAHVVAGDKSLAAVLIDGPDGVTILPAARGLDELALNTSELDGGWQARLSGWLGQAQRDFDVWLINGLPPAGGDTDVFLAIEPTAQGITCAYAQIKALAHCRGQRSFGIVIHRADSEASARATFTSVASTARRFLRANLDYRGAIPADRPAMPGRHQALLRLAQSIVQVPTLT
jgi:flagellar biosynthesis protein FlhG